MGGKGSGRRKEVKRQLRDAIDSIDCDRIFTQLDEWSQGKPVVCPHCFKDTGMRTADTVALQSALELLNRRLGKSVTQVSIDTTEQVHFSADQIDRIIDRIIDSEEFKARRMERGLVIEGEVKLLEANESQI